MKRKLLFVVIAVLISVLAYLYLRPAEPILSGDRVYDVTGVGETVLVNVTLTNVPGCSGWNMKLTWDPYYIQLSGVEEGPFFKTRNISSLFHVTSVDHAMGKMILADVFLAKDVFVQGTGVILTVNFTTVRVGTSTIEFGSPSGGTQASLGDATNEFTIDHVEVAGLISNEGPPPIWASTDFQSTLIIGEVAALGLASGIVYLRAHPRPPRIVKKREEQQPTIYPQDQE